jgi:hypothetical protein
MSGFRALRLAPTLALSFCAAALLSGCGGGGGSSASLPVGSGSVSTTPNGQVASYTFNMPSAGTMAVQFGTDTTYGRSTWKVASPTGGGLTTILVAGMLGNTTYHMRANITLADGTTSNDTDHVFTTTQSLPANQLPPTVQVSTAPGRTPQPGVELLTDLDRGALIYDLQGNLLWGFPANLYTGNDQIQPVKLMPNGHILIQAGASSSYALTGDPTIPAGTLIADLEVDYANNVINQLDLATLQTQFNAFGYKNDQGVTPILQDMHHEVTINPNTGHWLIMANTLETKTVTGYTTPVTVLGDIVIDVDPSNGFAVDWVWNEFDHLDVNRHPYMFPDWTHSNAIVYSADDRNILVSSRHQSWVMKVAYQDGQGNGDLVWRLGYQGDFELEGGTAPQDWQYAQHEPSFTTTNTTGTFGLILMDNGDSRIFPSGYQCGTGSNLPCLYSRAPIFTINESSMTATLSNPAISPVYNSFGGNAEVLANGDVEGDYCGGPTGSTILETTQGTDPQQVWSMATPGTNMYRGHRLPSMYPGVQW